MAVRKKQSSSKENTRYISRLGNSSRLTIVPTDLPACLAAMAGRSVEHLRSCFICPLNFPASGTLLLPLGTPEPHIATPSGRWVRPRTVALFSHCILLADRMALCAPPAKLLRVRPGTSTLAEPDFSRKYCQKRPVFDMGTVEPLRPFHRVEQTNSGKSYIPFQAPHVYRSQNPEP